MYGLTGKYRLDTRLGGGGMAEVFIGSTVGAEGFSRKIAIKRILPGFSDNPAFARMFVAEAQISSQLQHPNIVSVLDFDRDAENRLFLVMELVEGKDLDALVGSGLLPHSVVIHVIGEVLRGLGYAHNLPTSDSSMRGLVHRDVSPHNVLVSWEGAIKVSDFGIAKARAASNATASVFIKGKPQYMSPEQANGQPLDGRSDLFAVGVMLWEMLTGQRLFVGNTTQEVLARMLFAPIAWPRQVRPEVPVDLERIAMRLLERNLAARYATAEDAIEDLLACRDAPRGGRDELVALLAERFPGVAPSRPVRRPSLSGAPAAPYKAGETRAFGGAVPIPTQHPQHASPTATTARGGPTPTPNAVPIVAPPNEVSGIRQSTTVRESGPVAAMAAETRTVAPGEVPRSRMPLAVFIVGGGVAALLVVLIVLTVGRDKNKGDDGGSGSGGSGGSGQIASASESGAAPATTPDAAPAAVATVTPDAAPAAVATTTPDAAPSRSKKKPDARPADPPPKPDARPKEPDKPKDGCTVDDDEKRTGSVKITADPWAEVTIDGKKQAGQTPMTPTLKVGCHKIKLENSDLDKSTTRTVNIEAGKTEKVHADFQ
jgi:eukaryotic-like serine/threonine-protein kinase